MGSLCHSGAVVLLVMVILVNALWSGYAAKEPTKSEWGEGCVARLTPPSGDTSPPQRSCAVKGSESKLSCCSLTSPFSRGHGEKANLPPLKE